MNLTDNNPPDNDSANWKAELNKIMARYLTIGTYIAIVLNPLFGLVDYFTLHDLWISFMGIRIAVSISLLGFLLYKPFLKYRPQIAGFVILTTIITQDAYFFSLSSAESIHNSSLSYMIDFVGASMVLLWTPLMAIAFIAYLIVVNALFFYECSSVPFWQFIAEGGLLVFAGSIFCMAMIVFRYHSVKSMLISKFELIKSNEWMAVQNEIIEEKSMELQRSNNRLKEFAYIVSHDLKTPLRGIKNLALWIREDCSATLSTDGLSHLKMIDKQILKMENLIVAVLDYSKTGNGNSKMEWINLDELINDLIETVDIDKQVVFSVHSRVPQMKGTKVVLNQVLQNLISNSVKHNRSIRKEVEIEIIENDDNFQFRISDNGPGMEQRDHAKIFELFQVLGMKNNYESTGIGLPVAKKMVEESGGEMWLESEPGKGSSFFFTLPKNM